MIILVLLKNLPVILEIISHLQKEIDRQASDKKLADDLKVISQAFKDKDAEALRRLFNS